MRPQMESEDGEPEVVSKVQELPVEQLTLSELQEQLKPWQAHNFPQRESWEPLVGLQEELGEMSHAFLKAHQGIRMNENHKAKEMDAVGDILIYLADFCNARGHDMQTILEDTWSEVRQRNWR